jgi:hypothetical protein
MKFCQKGKLVSKLGAGTMLSLNCRQPEAGKAREPPRNSLMPEYRQPDMSSMAATLRIPLLWTIRLA